VLLPAIPKTQETTPENALSLLGRFKLNKRRRRWLYRKGTIWHDSRIGKNVCIRVFCREEITLKGMKGGIVVKEVNKLQERQNKEALALFMRRRE